MNSSTQPPSRRSWVFMYILDPGKPAGVRVVGLLGMAIGSYLLITALIYFGFWSVGGQIIHLITFLFHAAIGPAFILVWTNFVSGYRWAWRLYLVLFLVLIFYFLFGPVIVREVLFFLGALAGMYLFSSRSVRWYFKIQEPNINLK